PFRPGPPLADLNRDLPDLAPPSLPEGQPPWPPRGAVPAPDRQVTADADRAQGLLARIGWKWTRKWAGIQRKRSCNRPIPLSLQGLDRFRKNFINNVFRPR